MGEKIEAGPSSSSMFAVCGCAGVCICGYGLYVTISFLVRVGVRFSINFIHATTMVIIVLKKDRLTFCFGFCAVFVSRLRQKLSNLQTMVFYKDGSTSSERFVVK